MPAPEARAQSIDYTGLQAIYEEPITTSANGSPQRQSEVPLNMEIVTADDIARSGARTIPEILRFLPGINVTQKTFGQTELSVRGYNQNNTERILVLVNGRQVYTDFFGQVVWDNIPVEISEIKQIEVVKGPNTALFGFNAVSGVVNIITVNPLYDDLKVLEARAGTHELSHSIKNAA
jgi:outer membrane receptor for ferrienterochelin and colicins